MSSQNFSDRFLKFRALAGLMLVTRPKAWWHWKNSNEVLFRAGKLRPANDSPSMLFYAIHKSGSTISNQIAGEIAENSGLTKIDWEGYFATTEPEIKNMLFQEANLKNFFNPRGYMFGALRNYLPVPDEQQYKIFLQIRDPRDVLTSHFFSMTKSHPVLTRNYLNRKMQALHKTIDEHVIDTSPRFLKTYTDFIRGLNNKTNVAVLKYEDMVLNKEKWINAICNHLETDSSSSFISQLKNRYTFQNKSERPEHHIRKITPGDFREKLNDHTIEWLNRQFKDVLDYYNYPLK